MLINNSRKWKLFCFCWVSCCSQELWFPQDGGVRENGFYCYACWNFLTFLGDNDSDGDGMKDAVDDDDDNDGIPDYSKWIFINDESLKRDVVHVSFRFLLFNILGFDVNNWPWTNFY